MFRVFALTGSSSVRTTVLVVSPLVSLMIDQVESLRKRGVSAAILSGNEGVERSLLAQGKDLLVSTWQVQLAVYIP